MPQQKKMSVAIVGAGPAGYYTAEALAALNEKDSPPHDICVDILDRLPTPFGLIRSGVAPDHQSIKAVARRYTKTNERDDVRFVGNVALGEDISLATLLALYDAVVLATGAPQDRRLGLEGEALSGVYGSGSFVGWYNAHPDYRTLDPALDHEVAVVVGNGNVAVDVARLLARHVDDLDVTDVAHHAAEALRHAAIRHVYMVGRRGPLDASFTPKELAELNKLTDVVAIVDREDLPDQVPVDADSRIRKLMPHLEAMAANKPDSDKVTLHLKFFRRPVAIEGRGHITSVRFEKTTISDGRVSGTGYFETLPCGLLVAAIGYQAAPIADVPYDANRGRFLHKDGQIAPNLYCVGWARRGPTGTIGTNKPDGQEIAARIAAEVTPGDKPGRAGLERHIADNKLNLVSFRHWQAIDEAEVMAADGSAAPRVKFTRVDDMLRAGGLAPSE